MSGEAISTVKSSNMKEMIVRFGQCADATAELSRSLEKFTDIFTKIENNINILEETEKNLSSNDHIKKLIDVTDNMKDIFNYFKQNIPELSIAMEASKNQLNVHKQELASALEHLGDLPQKINDFSIIAENTAEIRTLLNEISSFQMDKEIEKIKSMLEDHSVHNRNMLDELQNYVDDQNKKMKNQYTRTKKKMLEEIGQQTDQRLLSAENEMLSKISDHVDGIIKENNQSILSSFEEMVNSIFVPTSNRDEVNTLYSVYDLYIMNGRRLPLKVRRFSWTSDFYFYVQKIAANVMNGSFYVHAYGQRMKGSQIYDDFSYGADLKEFVMHQEAFQPIYDDDIPF